MALAPGGGGRRDEADRLAAGVPCGSTIEVEAVDEATRRIGLGELLADQGADEAHVRMQRLLDPELAGDERMVHEVAADLVGAVGEVVGHQQQARRADAVGGEDHHVGRLEVPRPGAPIDVDRPGEAAVLAALEALDAGLRAQVDARLQRLRPDRERELAHRAARAAGNAARAAVAGGPPVVILRDHARRDRPPVPAEPVERACQPAADRAQRQRRRRVALVRRHRRIAGEPAHADDPVDAIVIGCEVLVGDRPVGREAVLDALAEVGWPIARPECRVDVGRAADRVPHQDVGARALDRIVVAAVADIVVRMPALLPLPFPVGAEVRVIVGRGPAALLEADHLEPRLAQHHARKRAAGARADHQDVGGSAMAASQKIELGEVDAPHLLGAHEGAAAVARRVAGSIEPADVVADRAAGSHGR